jgi:hypothetical protein
LRVSRKKSRPLSRRQRKRKKKRRRQRSTPEKGHADQTLHSEPWIHEP